MRAHYFDNQPHNKPHIHVHYQDESAVYEIPTGNVLAGYLPPAKNKLVSAWIEIDQEDLMPNYKFKVHFNNGDVKQFDVEPFLHKGIFVELKDEKYFSQVSVAYGAVKWPNVQGFSNDILYLLGSAIFR